MLPAARAGTWSTRWRRNCRRRWSICSAPTSPPSTWRRRPSGRAWRSLPATPRCSHPAGERVTVREALAFINRTLDEILTAQEGEFDADSLWALTWFDQHGFDAGEFGSAETLATAKNTSVAGMVRAGILHSRAGRVRLLRPPELPDDWDPKADDRLTTWEVVHHLIRVMGQAGEMGAASLLRRLGNAAIGSRDLCYRLYTLCERKKRADEALDYNGLVQSWPEIARLAVTEASEQQSALFDDDGAPQA